MNPTAASIHVASVHPAANATSASRAEEGAGAATLVDFSAILAEQLGPAAAIVPGAAENGMAVQDKAQLSIDDEKADTLADGASASVLPAAAMVHAGVLPVHPAEAMAADAKAVNASDESKDTGRVVDAMRSGNAVDLPVNAATLARPEAADLAGSTGGSMLDVLQADRKDTQPTPAAPSEPAFAAGLPASAQTSSTAVVDRAGAPGDALPLRSATFGEDVANRVTWLATHGRQEAEIRIDPPHLGPVEMRLSIAGDQATLSLVSPHAAVRDALQNSVPRLQEMLQAAGVNLGQVNVGSHSAGQQQGNAQQGARNDAGVAAGDDARDVAVLPATYRPVQTRSGVGLVDVFA